MRSVRFALAAVSLLAISAPAAAVQYRFDVVDPGSSQSQVGQLDGDTFFFFFDSSPTAAAPVSGSSFSLLGTVFYSIGGVAQQQDGRFDFLSSNIFGGLNTPIANYTGDQLYTGDETAPTFLLGTFSLNDGASITISPSGTTPPPPGAVPEPASWAMMVMGFGLIGAGLRARRTRVAFG